MKNLLQEKYNSIWQNYADSSFQHLLERGHAFHFDDDEKHSDVLFVGINPSFGKEDAHCNYTFDRNASANYFLPFHLINNTLKKVPYSIESLRWTHLDILAFRETNQKYIDTILKDSKGISFIYEQVEIAKQRIIRIQPKVIVVCNTKARELMGKDRLTDSKGREHGVWMDFNYSFDPEQGSYRIKDVPELKDTHVLFSSMLSGGRALDLGSRERLIWQIGRILQQ